MLNHLQTCPGGVNATDAAGWTCLHWAALDGKGEHVAALLDSGAEAGMVTTQPIVSTLHSSADVLHSAFPRTPAHGCPCGVLARRTTIKLALESEMQALLRLLLRAFLQRAQRATLVW